MKNKIFSSFMLSMVCILSANLSHAYSWRNIIQDTVRDTKELYQGRPELKGAYFFDLLEKGDARSKVGASIPVVAWKFITVDPAFIYTPDASKNTGEYGLSFSIRLSRVPLGDGYTVGDMFMECPEWLKRFHVGPFMSQNLTTGKFGFGVQSGVKF